jgi:alpha-D-ribose 1-methylphosphonate 5-triphosphate synthase subunit PhnH
MSAVETTLLPGFAAPVIDSQRIFRLVLDAMARPGTIVNLPSLPRPPAPIAPGAGAILLCLTDQDTPIWFDGGIGAPGIAPWLGFHCGSRLVTDPGQAAFALIADAAAMPELTIFPIGSEEYPDRSATVIVQVPALMGGEEVVLTGPGIRDRIALAPTGLPSDFKSELAANNALFPRGIDLIFVAGAQIAAVPRSTRVKG